MLTCLTAVPALAYYAGQALANITDAARLRRENLELRRDVANLKGVVRDMGETMQYLTHPATIWQRNFDYLEGKGEFGTPR